MSEAINSALKVFTGEYIMLLDMDDRLYPNAIKSKADFLTRNSDYGMVRNNGYYSFEEYPHRKWKFEKSGKKFKNDKIFEDLLLVRTNNWPGSYMVRSENFLELYPDRNIYVSRYGQNLQFMLPMAHFYKTGYIDKCLMEYVVHTSSLSHSKDLDKILQMINGYENIRKEVVNQMNISDDEKQQYFVKIEQKYRKDRLRFSIRSKNRKLFEEQYSLLKLHGCLTIWERGLYILYKMKYFSYFYKVYCHLVYLIKRTVI